MYYALHDLLIYLILLLQEQNQAVNHYYFLVGPWEEKQFQNPYKRQVSGMDQGPISLTLPFAIIVKSVANLKWSLKGLAIIFGFH